MKNLISIIVPCYNEEDSLPLFMEAIRPVRKELSGSSDIELIFIDDGSTDSTLKLLKSYHAADPFVRFISFSRNFGKEAGIYAGLKASKGDYVVLMDADLQHPVEYIPEMYRILSGSCRHEASQEQAAEASYAAIEAVPGAEATQSGIPASGRYDSVAMCRQSRKGKDRIRSFFSRRFFHFMNRLSKINLVDGATDYRMMTRKMVDAVLSMQEYNRFTKGIFNWVGFDTLWLSYRDVPRKAGHSKWSFPGLLRYSLEGMFAFSTAPLTISFWLGLIFCLIALLFAVYVVIKTMIWGDPVAGFPTLFCVILFFGGMQLFFLGVFGQYLSKMYLEVKHRPLYIVKEESED